jgi:hypothetical protein
MGEALTYNEDRGIIMGLRIIKSKDPGILRTQLIGEEADRYGCFRGDNFSLSLEQFHAKLTSIRELIPTEEEAQRRVQFVIEQIKAETQKSLSSQTTIKPHIALDLL